MVQRSGRVCPHIHHAWKEVEDEARSPPRGNAGRPGPRRRRATRRRPPDVHDAQRRHRLGRGHHGLHADREAADCRGLGAAACRAQGRLAGPRRQEADEGAGDDDDRGVLQGGPGPVELAHDRPDADHLRLLPALHEAAEGEARPGHRPEGAPLREPERHGPRPRHRARLPRRHRRQGAGHRGPAVPRRPARQAGPGLPGQAGRQELRRLAQGRRLRRPQGRLPAPEHHDVQADGRGHRAPRAGVLLGRRRLHRVEGLRAPQEGPAEVPVRDDEGAPGPRRGEQAVRRADRDGQRGRRVGQDRGRGQRLPRQDLGRHGRDRQVRPRRCRSARCRGRSS